MSIQYIQDQVTFSDPVGDQTDYEATINIVFSTVIDGAISEAYLYSQKITGGTSYADIMAKRNDARVAITNDVLLAYAAGTPAVYTPPPPPPQTIF